MTADRSPNRAVPYLEIETFKERARYLEIENSALRAQLKALQEKATDAKVYAVEAENAGLRRALESLRADMDLAKDLGAKADAVREECAKAAEARGYGGLAEELRGMAR